MNHLSVEESSEESIPLHSKESDSHSHSEDEDGGVFKVGFGEWDLELGAEREDDDGGGSSHLQDDVNDDDGNNEVEKGFLKTFAM